MADIAVNANGYGMFVHNWKGQSLMPTTGVEGITFVPGSIDSQAVSIVRSTTELLLSTSKGGTFYWSDSLEVISASIGYFDRENAWVDEFSSYSIAITSDFKSEKIILSCVLT